MRIGTDVVSGVDMDFLVERSVLHSVVYRGVT